MLHFDEYSLFECLIDPSYDDAPKLRNLGGSVSVLTAGVGA